MFSGGSIYEKHFREWLKCVIYTRSGYHSERAYTPPHVEATIFMPLPHATNLNLVLTKEIILLDSGGEEVTYMNRM
jgi:hypothetical protein